MKHTLFGKWGVIVLALSLAAGGCEDPEEESDFDYADVIDEGKADGAGADLRAWVMPAGVTQEQLAQHGRSFDYAQLMNEAVYAGLVVPPGAYLETEEDDVEVDGIQHRSLRFSWGVMSRYAATAGVVSQLDTPAPGPGDLIALGILAIGLGHALFSSPSTQTCQPCPMRSDQPEPDRVDCVPPSRPHYPCQSHHIHIYWWEANQNPNTCQCFYNARSDVLCYEDAPTDPTWDVCL